MKATEAATKRYIRECVEYIEAQRAWDRELLPSADDHAVVRMKLERAERHLRDLMAELHGVEQQMHGQLKVLNGAWPLIRGACECAARTSAPLAAAKSAMEHQPATRALREQKTAINQAHAYLEPPGKPNRGTRDLARRIMDAAGIEHPSPEAITKWLRDIRADWDASERRCAEVGKAERNGK